MKADMGGAASVSAAFEAIARLHLPVNVTALIPLCENMPSGCANKPGDVVTARNGKTIEVCEFLKACCVLLVSFLTNKVINRGSIEILGTLIHSSKFRFEIPHVN